MILNNAKKLQIPLVSIILLSLVLSFAVATLALAAQSPAPIIPGQTAFEQSYVNKASSIGTALLLWPLNTVITAILLFLSWLVTIAGTAFDASLVFSLSVLRQSAAIKAGWDISRNVANLFFILILLAIAVATILRVQTHNAKALLIKLIVIALLINFSLTMGYVIIDAANILGLQFYNAITNNGTVAVTTKIMEGTKLQNLFNVDSPPQAAAVTNNGSSWTQLSAGTVLTTIGGILGGGIVCAVTACAAAIPVALGIAGGGFLGAATNFIKNSAGLDFTQASLYFSEVLGTTIFFVPLIFILFVGAIFFLIRSAMLILLLILSPIAFISYVLPETESRLWKPWWAEFLCQAFFLPAFMFLLYISISFLIEIAKIVPSAAPIKSMPVLMLNIIAVVMLLASLLLAKKMGCMGGSLALSWATTGRKWLTGVVGGVAARSLVAPIGARLQQSQAIGRITRASPTLGYYARQATGWLAARGKAPEQAENMAKAALGQAESTWGSSFQKLNRAGKEAMLRGMTPEQRATFVNSLTGSQKTIAENILRSPQFSAAEQAKFNLEEFRRMPLDQQKARFATYDAQTQESILKGLNDEEKANFIGSLEATNPTLATSAENILKSRLSPKDYQSFKVAKVARQPKSTQTAAWSQPDFTEDDKEALLRKMKSDEDRAEFVDSLGTPGAPARDSAESVIRSRFAPKDYQSFKVASILRKPENEQRNEWLALDPTTGLPKLKDDDKEALLRKKDAKGQARFIDGLVGTADKAAAQNIIQTRFSAGEQRAHKEAAIENVASKPVSAIKTAIATMPPEDLEILVKVGDENKIVALINTIADRSKVKNIGKAIKKLGLDAKYRRYLNPIDKVEFIDEADPASPDFQERAATEIRNTSPRDIAQRTQPKVIETDVFKQAFLGTPGPTGRKGGGGITQLISLIDTPAKADAVKRMLAEATNNNLAAPPGDIIRLFETKYNNKELGQQIVELRDRARQAMSPVEKQFIQQVFG
ncbi:MAG: hypothetical protein HYW15_00585 [Candidatus Giovannonibacteria bacterium]|nr:MAG: hypothetical protein HYW15_00585 [Candidatus Giovannonibacteria bacterium]